MYKRQILDRKGQVLSDIHIFPVVVNTAKLYGMESLPLRGHRDEKTSDPLTNRGVFNAILEHGAKCDPILWEHLEQGKKNQQYITVIADCMRHNILTPLKHMKYFSVIADEVTRTEIRK